MATIKERYDTLLAIYKPLSPKQFHNKKKKIHVKVTVNIGQLAKNVYTNEHSSTEKYYNEIMDLLITNCIIEELEPVSDIDISIIDFLKERCDEDKVLYLTDYLESYLQVQLIKREPAIFEYIMKHKLNLI